MDRLSKQHIHNNTYHNINPLNLMDSDLQFFQKCTQLFNQYKAHFFPNLFKISLYIKEIYKPYKRNNIYTPKH